MRNCARAPELEVANAFLSAIRRKRVTAGYRDQALAELMKMPSPPIQKLTRMRGRQGSNWPSVSGHGLRFSLFELARRHSLVETIPV